MSDATDGKWPNASNRGLPLNPEKDGCHWVTHPADIGQPNGMMAVYWNGKGGWCLPSVSRLIPPAEMGVYLYHGPCLTPAEVTALQAAAWRAGRDAALEAVYAEGVYGDAAYFRRRALEAIAALQPPGDLAAAQEAVQ